MLIDTKILTKLPRNMMYIKDDFVEGRDAILIMWSEDRVSRKAYFCARTGDYLGEA